MKRNKKFEWFRGARPGLNRFKYAAVTLISLSVIGTGGLSALALSEPGEGIAKHHYLPANAKTVRWGNIGIGEPTLTVNSGDFITVETVTHHSGDDYERIIQGDAGVEDIFHWTETEKNVADRGPGVHILTGPIAVTGAEPGDVLEVRIMDMALRPSGNPDYSGKTYGSNAAANWGYLYNELLEEPKKREVITIYEMDSSGGEDFATAAYSYRWTTQTDPDGKEHATIDYPGVIVDPSTIEKDENVLDNIRIPVRLHFGTMGVAPREADIVDSVPPSYFGGNIDDWRIGRGATMYYPVAVEDALLSIGDPHAAQGDSELSGTAIETSITGTIQVILHKKETLEDSLIELDFPLLENDHVWVVHGFSYANYLEALGSTAQKDIYQKSSVDLAMKDAAYKMRRFLMQGMGLTEDEAISLMSVAVDFGITQVVDGNWGVHATLDKRIFGEQSVEMLMVRTAAEALGAEVVWDGAARTITLTKGERLIHLDVDSSTIEWNGNKLPLPSPIILKDGSAWVPANVLKTVTHLLSIQ